MYLEQNLTIDTSNWIKEKYFENLEGPSSSSRTTETTFTSSMTVPMQTTPADVHSSNVSKIKSLDDSFDELFQVGSTPCSTGSICQSFCRKTHRKSYEVRCLRFYKDLQEAQEGMVEGSQLSLDISNTFAVGSQLSIGDEIASVCDEQYQQNSGSKKRGKADKVIDFIKQHPTALHHILKKVLCKDFTRTVIPAALRNGKILFFLRRTMASVPTTDSVLINENKHYATIEMNRPEVLNAINSGMIRKIHAHLKKFEKSKSFIIVKGSGDKSFSVGGDIAALLKAGLNESRIFFREVYTLLYFISKSTVPNIALIDGVTMGGGVGLAVHGKYCVATELTVLAMPETAIGLFPDVGSSYFLNRLNGKLGLYLGMTGNRLMAQDVARVGLATHFCESGQLANLESELIKSTNPNEVPKILNNFSMKISKEEGINLLMNKINASFNAATVEEIFENLEKDGSKWALKTLETLKEKSPLSLKLTFRQMQMGANLPLDQCLKMEYRIASRRLGNSDFQEGVRALLIDKDKNPVWNPRTLEAVTEDIIAEFFASLTDNEELRL